MHSSTNRTTFGNSTSGRTGNVNAFFMENPISNRYFANVSFVENDHDTSKVSTISKVYDDVDKISSVDSNIELDGLPSQSYSFGKGESSSLLALLDVDDDFNNDTENDVSPNVLAPNVINVGKHGSVRDKVKSSESSKNKPQKKKRVKKMKPPPPQELTNLIPKVPTQQSRAHAQLLFDYIAPHVDKHVMEYLLIKMREFEVQMRNELEIKEQQQELESSHGASKKKKISKQKLKEYKTIVGRLDAFFSSKDANTKKMKKMGTHVNAGLEKYPWIKSLIAQFFAGSGEDPSRENKEHIPVKENMPASLSMELIWQDPTFTPNLNREKHDETVSTLMRAREMSLESPLLWSNNQRKRVKKQTVEEKWEMVRREKHYGKSPQELKVEAETMASILSFRLPVDAHDELLRLFKGYADNVKETIMNEHETKIQENDVELFDDKSIRKGNNDDNMSLDIERKVGPKRHVEIMKMLFPNLKRRVGFHMHLVAMELAEFFYVDVPEQTRSEVEAVAIPETVDGIPYFPIGRSDVRISESWNNWNSLRDDVANVLLSSQHMYVRLHSALKKGESSRKEKHDKNDNKHPTEEEIDNVMAQYSNEANERTEELVEQLDKLRTTENDEVVGGIHLENEKKGPSSKPINLRFDCLMLNEKFGPYSYTDTSLLADLGGLQSNNMAKVSQDIAAILPETNKIIFIENLPIDVTKDELMTLYSRCGPIESLEIYNLRPEVDPGELSLKKTTERKKRRRMSGMKGAKHKSKSRTPVYAVIKFKGEEG